MTSGNSKPIFKRKASPRSGRMIIAQQFRVCFKTQLVRYSSVIFNAKDAKEFAKERKEDSPLRPLRKTLRPLRLSSRSFTTKSGFDTASSSVGYFQSSASRTRRNRDNLSPTMARPI